MPKKLVFDGSKKQRGKNTECVKEVRKHSIDHHISEPDHHDQNPVEGVMREVRKTWFKTKAMKK